MSTVKTIHANCLKIGNKGIILAGASGSGKSVLTLSLLERSHWAQKDSILVSDDYTDLTSKNGKLYGQCPATLRGGIEIRGAGLYQMPFLSEVAVDFIVELGNDYERFPSGKKLTYFGISVPLYRLPALGQADCTAICQAIEAICFKKLWTNHQ